MKLINKRNSDIVEDKELGKKFISVTNNNFNINCKILKDFFYLDSHNYYPISKEMYSFSDIFQWGDQIKYNNFYNDKFITNFKNNKKNFKNISDVVVLGSSIADNYYRNMLTFLPRIFFLEKGKIRLVINRKSSNKFRNFISILCQKIGIEIEFIFLDNGFYSFSNSKIMQYLDKDHSIKILNSLVIKNKVMNEKIYISRQNTKFRNIINEVDIIEFLKKDGFRIIDLNSLSIIKQIDLFSKASTIISPTGSGLSNIVFCSPGVKVIEITPKYNFVYEDNLKNRYSYICKRLGLNYFSFNADPIEIDSSDKIADSFILPGKLKQSNYYKNLLLRLDVLNEIIKV